MADREPARSRQTLNTSLRSAAGSGLLSELFSSPERPLGIYHLTLGKAQTSPCPMWIDGFNGVAHHHEQNADFAVASADDPAQLRARARGRG